MTFVEIEGLLARAVHELDPAPLSSAFSGSRADVAPVQAELAQDYARQVRLAIGESAKRLGVAAPAFGRSALQASRVAIARAIEAAQSLLPDHDGGDPIPDALRAELGRMRTQISDPLEWMLDALMPPRPRSVPERGLDVARAGDDSGTAPAARLGADLKELTRRDHSTDLEIGVFGETNSGKSSLANRLLGNDLLPVGPIPATCVPVRIELGRHAKGWVEFAQTRTEMLEWNRLKEFATHHFNPGNARHVVRLTFRNDAQILGQGVSIVDLPGTGECVMSLWPAGVCVDIGLVAVDASGSLALRESALVHHLLRTGSEVLVLMTKADRLEEGERWDVLGYVQREINRRVGRNVPVYPVGATDPKLRGDWIERGLRPLLQARGSVRRGSLERKLAIAREALREARERQRDAASIPGGRAGLATFEAKVDEVLAELTDAIRRPDHSLEQALRETALAIEEACHNAAVISGIHHGAALDASAMIAASLEAHALGAATQVRRRLLALRSRMICLLAVAESACGIEATRSAALPQAPRFDPFRAAATVGQVAFAIPAFHFLGRWRRAAAFRGRIAGTDLAARCTGAMRAYFDDLQRTRTRWLDEAIGFVEALPARKNR